MNAHSSDASKGPRVELRGREARNPISKGETQMGAQTSPRTMRLPLEALRLCSGGADAISALQVALERKGVDVPDSSWTR